jgi:DNA-binding transcriptional regulator YiaG
MPARDIVALRKVLRLSPRPLAEKLDVPVSLVHDWERGERFTTKKHHEMLVRLAAAPEEPPASSGP